MYKKIAACLPVLCLFLCGCGKNDYGNVSGNSSVSYSCEEICVINDCNYSGPSVTVSGSDSFFYSDGYNNIYSRNIDADSEPELLLTLDSEIIYSLYYENGILNILSAKSFDEINGDTAPETFGETGYVYCLWEYYLESRTLECSEPETDNADLSEYFPETSCAWNSGFLYEKTEDGNQKPVLDWSVVDIFAEDVIYAEKLADENYLICLIYGDNQYEVCHISAGEGRTTNKTELVLGGAYIDDEIRRCVIDFNKSSAEYEVTVRDYSNNDDPYTALNLDFTSGKQIDILMTGNLNIRSLAENGAVLDLSDYFETADYVDSYVRAISNGGKIYQVAPEFGIYTLAGKESIVGSGCGWTYEEFMETVKNNSRAQLTFGATEYNLLDIMCIKRLPDFINEENAETYFDSEEFREILEYIKNYDKEADMNQNYLDSLYTGETLFQQIFIDSATTYMMYDTAFGGDMVLKGYPLENNVGNYMFLYAPMGISATSEYPEEAWEFIEYVMSYKVEEWEQGDGFPTEKKQLEQTMKKCKTDKEYYSCIVLGGKEVEVPLLDKSGEENLYELIDSADILLNDDSEISIIVTEEAFSYFDGNYIPDDVCKNIESRVSMYLKENY